MAETNIQDRLNTEEGKTKAESLFSKQFRDYLKTKKASKASALARTHNIKPFVRDYSGSSSETASESSKKSVRKSRKKTKEKKPYWNVQFLLRNRLVQCSLLQGEAEVVPPDDLKPLLMNITVLLQELKQLPSEYENLYNLIAKITLLLAQFIRRPFQKIPEDGKGNHMKSAEKTVKAMITLLDDYRNEPNLDPDNSLREYKRIEKDLLIKEQEIKDVKKRINNRMGCLDPNVKDMEQRVKNSILANEHLRFDIKFNQNRLKKYKKVLMEKEWAKHKLENELAHLKRKVSKADLSDNDSLDKISAGSESGTKKDMFSKIHLKNPNAKTKKGKKHNK